MGCVIGLTGKYCAGKSTIALEYEKKGAVNIDADALAHKVLKDKKQQIAGIFGEQIIDSQGNPDRRALAEIVFKDPEKLQKLEGIIHPGVLERIKELVNQNKDKTVVVHAALLFSSSLHKICDKIIIVKAPLLTRIRRGLNRDGISIISVLRRIYVQRNLIPKKILSEINVVTIKNKGMKTD